MLLSPVILLIVHRNCGSFSSNDSSLLICPFNDLFNRMAFQTSNIHWTICLLWFDLQHFAFITCIVLFGNFGPLFIIIIYVLWNPWKLHVSKTFEWRRCEYFNNMYMKLCCKMFVQILPRSLRSMFLVETLILSLPFAVVMAVACIVICKL